ncbi:arsenate reductase ArsC [Flavobacteriaceae bacterium]|jgi:arsenate reductase|nr:arsenate reductase ArsC [Flavobacteriaceae bacterium]MDA8938266.1 arsenate reductase ArsC [Flavobacteriaceae bacterium]MDA9339242.1 arsenate reductase ArsC [Flavobacteriaceae bacterium]MDA9362232.1 arsenate reductase ArsC [Flavobacteriaceae bacterium]MDB3901540.1 arsenate reductase ArsC [Flavobacteriaceae bacterium]|tara:strand:- start:2245 stop:2661 length:417 start_codon:yes stop_codon:yes gene_type:complete
MKNILILCTGNSCRSQIAHGYFNKFSNNKCKIYSAGIETHGLNPNAVQTMLRDDIDISTHTSNDVNEYLDINFDYIITVCDHANESCPNIPSKNALKIHKNFLDPSKIENSINPQNDFDNCRDEIKNFTLDFYKKYID